MDGGGVEECKSRVNRGDFALLFPDELAEEGDFEGVFLPGLRQLRVLLRQATQLAQYRVEREGRFIGVGVEEELKCEFAGLSVEEATAVED